MWYTRQWRQQAGVLPEEENNPSAVYKTFFANGMIQKFFPSFDDTLSTQYQELRLINIPVLSTMSQLNVSNLMNKNSTICTVYWHVYAVVWIMGLFCVCSFYCIDCFHFIVLCNPLYHSRLSLSKLEFSWDKARPRSMTQSAHRQLKSVTVSRCE